MFQMYNINKLYFDMSSKIGCYCNGRDVSEAFFSGLVCVLEEVV